MKLRGCRMSLGSQEIIYKLTMLCTILAHDAVQVRQLCWKRSKAMVFTLQEVDPGPGAKRYKSEWEGGRVVQGALG